LPPCFARFTSHRDMLLLREFRRRSDGAFKTSLQRSVPAGAR
jgi:hypothetical protein